MTSHRFHLWTMKYASVSPNWHPLCKGCSGLCNPWENLWFWAICETTAPRYIYLKLVTIPSCFSLLDLPLDTSGAGQDTNHTMVYKIMLSWWFSSQVNLKPAFLVSDLQVSCHQQNCCGFLGLCPQTPLNITSFMEHLTSDLWKRHK